MFTISFTMEGNTIHVHDVRSDGEDARPTPDDVGPRSATEETPRPPTFPPRPDDFLDDFLDDLRGME